jgi:hypothetical protein
MGVLSVMRILGAIEDINLCLVEVVSTTVRAVENRLERLAGDLHGRLLMERHQFGRGSEAMSGRATVSAVVVS